MSSANPWFLTFHLVGLFIYLGGLLSLSRMLGYHVREAPEVRARLSWMERRMYFFVTLPGLFIAALFGTLMLLGVGDGADLTIAQSLGRYLNPHGANPGERSFWWVTFHLKLTLFAILLLLDFTLVGRSIVKLSKGGEVPRPTRFKILHGMIALIMVGILILMKVGPLKGI